jgi:hypothetical protein
MGTCKISALRKFTSVRILTQIRSGRLSEVCWGRERLVKEMIMGCTGSRDSDRFRLQSCPSDGLERSDGKIYWIDFSYLFGLGHEGIQGKRQSSM